MPKLTGRIRIALRFRVRTLSCLSLGSLLATPQSERHASSNLAKMLNIPALGFGLHMEG